MLFTICRQSNMCRHNLMGKHYTQKIFLLSRITWFLHALYHLFKVSNQIQRIVALLSKWKYFLIVGHVSGQGRQWEKCPYWARNYFKMFVEVYLKFSHPDGENGLMSQDKIYTPYGQSSLLVFWYLVCSGQTKTMATSSKDASQSNRPSRPVRQEEVHGPWCA